MGKRGPQPTPTPVLKLRGSRRARGRAGEPKPPADVPSCPRWLDAEAKREWKRVIPQLASMGVLSSADMATIAGYCQQWSKWVAAERKLRSRASRIGTIEHRRVSITADSAFAAMLRAAAKLGLSPSDRTGLARETKSDDDPLAALLNRKTNAG